jgi:dTDP-3-amino-3,4,6-trideoxy-alpha-D-glucose transaminase
LVAVSFLDLSRALGAERQALAAALDRIVASGRLVLGPEVEAFERDWAAYLGTTYAVGVASGTDAIELALRALEIGPGDEVIVPSLTAPACGSAVLRAGAELVLADVDDSTLVLDPSSVAQAASPSTRAVLAVHLYGRPAPLAALERLGVPVVEDAAQAQGLRIGDHLAGTVSRLGCFSFYPTKNLGALGDGGAVVTSDAELADRLRALRQYGEHERYRGELAGVNSRLDELQAAFLRARLTLLDTGNARRAAIALAYDDALGRRSPAGVHHLYVIRVRDRERFREELAARGIATLVHYPYALHEQPAYASCRRVGSLDASERAAREIVSIPCYPELRDDEVAAVCAALSELRDELAA